MLRVVLIKKYKNILSPLNYTNSYNMMTWEFREEDEAKKVLKRTIKLAKQLEKLTKTQDYIVEYYDYYHHKIEVYKQENKFKPLIAKIS